MSNLSDEDAKKLSKAIEKWAANRRRSSDEDTEKLAKAIEDERESRDPWRLVGSCLVVIFAAFILIVMTPMMCAAA